MKRVFVSVVKNDSKQVLKPILLGHVLKKSDIHTDGWRAYTGLVIDGYKHHRVHHHKNECVRGKSHGNGIESFWSFAKYHLSLRRGIRLRKVPSPHQAMRVALEPSP